MVIALLRMLRCLWKDGQDVPLVPNVDVAIGRRPEMAITDTKCPRHHLDVRFDDEAQTAIVRLHSTSERRKSFAVNGKEVTDQQILKPGDTLQILPGKYEYRFEIPDKTEDQATEKMAAVLKTVSVSAVKSETVNRGHDQKSVASRSKAVAVSVLTEVIETKAGWPHVSDDLLVYTNGSAIGSEKIAGFDLDGTLITTKSGLVFGKDIDDWQIAFAPVPGKLKKLRDDGYRVVIFTNQAGIPQRHSVAEFQKKIGNILDKIGKDVVAACFVSTGQGRYRKPMIGMWEEYENRYNYGVTVDRSKSIYVGDAAGRGQSDEKSKAGTKRRNGEPRKDHSCCDRLFAMNLGIKFMTPEEFFLDSPPQPFKLPAFSSKALLDQRSSISLLDPSTASLARSDKKPELIVLVGYPASGKSQFYENYLKPLDYACVSRDKLGTWQKCCQEASKFLKAGRSVVVDNTNPDSESRKRYVDVAIENGAPCRCFVMNCDYNQAMHNNKFRHILGADREHKDVNVMVINTHRSKFEQPTANEGFEEIVQVNFIPKFDDPEKESLYGMYLLEK